MCCHFLAMKNAAPSACLPCLVCEATQMMLTELQNHTDHLPEEHHVLYQTQLKQSRIHRVTHPILLVVEAVGVQGYEIKSKFNWCDILTQSALLEQKIELFRQFGSQFGHQESNKVITDFFTRVASSPFLMCMVLWVMQKT